MFGRSVATGTNRAPPKPRSYSIRNALLHLRASDRIAPREWHDATGWGADRPSSLRISSDGRLILKPVEGDPPRHAITSIPGWLPLAHPSETATLHRVTTQRTVLRGWRPTVHAAPVARRSLPSGCRASGTTTWVTERVSASAQLSAEGMPRMDRPGQISSRCSTPCLETLPLVISPGIQSGLSSGADSSHAQPS
jgi:hypothetical protein